MKVSVQKVIIGMMLLVSGEIMASTRNTMLLKAVRTFDNSLVTSLLDEMTPEEECTEFEESALMAAIYHGNNDAVKLLIEKGANVDKKKSFKSELSASWDAWPRTLVWDQSQTEEENFCSGKTPIAIALLKHNIPALKLLLTAGADTSADYQCACEQLAVFRPYGWGDSADRIHKHNPLEIAALQEGKECFKLVLEATKELKIEPWGKAILASAFKGNSWNLSLLFKGGHLNVSERPEHSNCPLWPKCYLDFVDTEDYSMHSCTMRHGIYIAGFYEEQVIDASLLMAVKNGDSASIKVLFGWGPQDVSIFGKAILKKAFLSAIDYGHRSIVEDFLLGRNGIKQLSSCEVKGALVRAIERGDDYIIKAILALEDQVDDDAIIKAIEKQNPEILRLLLAALPADSYFITSKRFDACLVYACMTRAQDQKNKKNKHEIVRLLLDKGAKIDSKTAVGLSLVGSSMIDDYGYVDYTPLAAAVVSADQELAEELIIKYHANVNGITNINVGLRTALTYAVEQGLVDMTKMLLRHGADPRVTTLDIQRCRTARQQEAFTEVIEHMLKKGNLPSESHLDKETALLLAVASKQGITYAEAKRRLL